MKKQLNQILKNQMILEFEKKGLKDLIVFFMIQYPEFPYIELNVEQIHAEYLKSYDISFLASYIRYSDLYLLKSGMQDEAVKEKLCYLYEQVGTITPSYRKFIWSNDITVEDIKRWLPLLSSFQLKNRIMKCQKITEKYKRFLDCCLDETSFAYQNLVLLDLLYPITSIEIDRLAGIQNQEAFYKLLQIVVKNNISVSYQKLFDYFANLHKILEQFSSSFLEHDYHLIVEYLKSPLCNTEIQTMEDLQAFSQLKIKEHRHFLEQEYDVLALKEFYCWQFLGLHYQDFKVVFNKLPDDQSKQYQLLKELEFTKFPLSLKENLYQRFLECKDLQDYFRISISKIDITEELDFTFYFSHIDKSIPIMDMQGIDFQFFSASIKDYEDAQQTFTATLQSDTSFSYGECLVGYLKPMIVSYKKNIYTIKKEKPDFLVAFDHVSFELLKYQKLLQLPIVIIDTEVYAEKQVYLLEKMYDYRDWDSYLTQKRNFFLSIWNHPWLFLKYFNHEKIYQDVTVLQKKITTLDLKHLPLSFIKKQLQVLKRLISLDKELETMFLKERKNSFQSVKKMLQ